MKKLITLFLALSILFTLSGCGFMSDMPFNGDIEFHDLSLTIPESFIRDSTQSDDDLWLFEKGFYDQLIILSRQDLDGEEAVTLEDYAAYLTEQGVDVNKTTFLQHDAVHSTYTREDQFCQEMLFVHNGSIYALALRGGTVEEFDAFLKTVSLKSENGGL